MNPEGWHCLTETATEESARLSERGASQPYFYLVAQGIFGLVLDRFGGGRGANARLFFTLNADLKMDHALVQGHEIQVWLRPIRRTDKVIETGISILNMTVGRRLAFCHHTGAYISRETRRIDPLGQEATRLWDEQAGRESSIDIMQPMPAHPRGNLASEPCEGVIEAGWTDRMGHMGIEHYGLILDRAAETVMRAMTPPRQTALPRRVQVRYLKEMPPGMPFHVQSWPLHEKGSPLRIEHELWSGAREAPMDLAARCVEESAEFC